MRERPIILTDWQVRAFLAGTKTQHRVVMRPQPPPCDTIVRDDEHEGSFNIINYAGRCAGLITAPYALGDRLWVRETCRAEELSRPHKERAATHKERERFNRVRITVFDELDGANGIRYLADDEWRKIENTEVAGNLWTDLYRYGGGENGERLGKVVPAMHMPKWAARITLTVISVRAQLLRQLSEADARSEGPPLDENDPASWFANTWPGKGPASWDANPWVWRIEFKKENGDA